MTKRCVSTCPAGSYSHSSGKCLTVCPSSFFGDPFLHRCHTSCTNSYFSDPTTNMCVPVCPYGYFGDITSGYKCVKTCTVST